MISRGAIALLTALLVGGSPSVCAAAVASQTSSGPMDSMPGVLSLLGKKGQPIQSTICSDTLVLNGEVGDFVTIARKDRNSNDWYLGAVTDEQARVVNVTLNFLDEGRRYTAQIYRDGDDADWQR